MSDEAKTELKTTQDLTKEIKEGNIAQTESKRLQEDAVKNVAEQLLGYRDIKRQIDDIVGITRRRSEEERALIGIANELSSIGTQNFELARKGRQLDKLRNKLTGIQANTQSEILILQKQIESSKGNEFKRTNEIVALQKKLDTMEGVLNKKRIAGLEVDESSLDKIKEEIRLLVKGFGVNDKVLSQDAMRLIGLQRLNSAYETTSETLGKTEKTQKNINQVTGITGELLEGVNRIGLRVLGGLGVNLGVISESFEVGREAMVEFGKEVSRTREIEEQLSLLRGVNLKTGEGITAEIAKQLGLYNEQGKALTGADAADAARLKNTKLIEEKAKSTSDTFARTRSLIKGITALSGQLGKVLTDPMALAAILLKHFGDLNKEAVKFQRLTGQTAPLLDTLNMKLASSVQFLEVASSLSERLGINVTGAFSSQNLASAAELMNTMGMTAEAAGQLALISETNRTSVDGTLNNVVGQVNAYNRTNRTALNHGQIVNDIAKASEETLASFAGQSGELGKAAAVARRLGVELSKLESIADNLLNFESSIESELQAQLLTGMDINLNKARELALTNQIGKMGEEIFNNTVGIEKFSRMNRIEQQSMAKALGMSRQELARIALQRGIEVELTNEALENAAGMTAEDFKRVEAMQQLTVSIQKIGQALAGPAEFLAGMLGNSIGLYSTLGLITGLLVTKTIVAVKSLAVQLVKSGIAASVVRGGLTGFAGLGAIAAAAGLATYLMNREPDKIKDGIISPDGGLMVSGPKGSIQLDPQDSIIAGTNLGGQGGGTNRQAMDLIRKMDELISAVKQGGDVFLDGDKVGTALTMGSYRNS